MLQLLRPNSSNLPCLYSTFHLEYPLVLSRFCIILIKIIAEIIFIYLCLKPPKNDPIDFNFPVCISTLCERHCVFGEETVIVQKPGFSIVSTVFLV